MPTRRTRLLGGIAVALGLAGATAGGAQPSMHLTTFLTFTTAVALPGTTLQPGTYRFELAHPWSDQHTVVVRTGDGQRLRYLGQTRLVQRPPRIREAAGVQLGEAPAGQPQPIAVWYPPDAGHGRAFVYR